MNQSGFRMKNKLTKCDAEDELETDDIQVYLKNRILEDNCTCHDQQVFNDTEIYACFKMSAKSEIGKNKEYSGDWEEVEKVSGTVFEYDYPQKKKEVPKEDD